MELQWVERVEPAPHLGPDIGQIVCVLQFRVPIPDPGVYFVRHDDRMTPWQDVPVVRDTQGKP